MSGAGGAANTRAKGRSGEERAVTYLLEKGYRILARNYQTRKGEIDCIAEAPDTTLVFVEVKSSRGTGFANPLFWVTPSKQRQIAMMARWYLAEHKLHSRACRFDVVALSGPKIEHLQNAFLVS